MTKTFRDLGVDADMSDALTEQNIISPFTIQELTLPLAFGGHDLIGQARTGTGKTLAFGLPLLQAIDPGRRETQALVVVPTRELCVQVHDDLTIGERRGITSISVYGGVAYEPQIEALTSGVHVVVGTPGRLLDHLNRGNLDLSKVSVLVLDEADEMLDMGFLPDVERLIEACPTQRHTMLFSATMPTAIVKLARRYLDHPTFTRADTEAHEVAPTVEQHFFAVHRMDKPRVLARILQSPERGGSYVFVRTKHMADRLVTELEDLSVPAVAIHGDLRQQTRERNLDRFRSGKADVLVATEVAARGLDVTGVTHVFNYDCPDDEKMYLHRIGRTARAGEAGVAVTFAEFNEADRLNVIRKAVGAHDTPIEQVFSTSDLLTERFQLPEARPWDHLAQSGTGSSERVRKGRSDGRPKSSRRAEGSGAQRDATRRRDRPSGDASRRTEPAKAPTTGNTDTSGPVRTRTRTRQRAEEAPTGSSRTTTANGTRAAGERDGRSGAREPDTSGSARGRSRSRGGRDGERDERPRDERPRADRVAQQDPPARSEPAGSRSRGTGQPQLARRVKVEHLP